MGIFRNFLVVSIFLIALVIVFYNIPGATPDIKSPNAIALLEPWIVNDAEQWVLIRGKNKENPVLLFLHGGAGSPDMPFHHSSGQNLEDDFVVVRWDQRGAGKSFDPYMPDKSFTVEQFVDDACELSLLLRERLSARKIYIVGHSWGTVLGVLAARQCPENYFAYVGVGQVVDYDRAPSVAYEQIKARADEENDQKMLAKLAEIDLPLEGVDTILKFQKLRDSYGGEFYEPGTFWKYILAAFSNSPEYSLKDFIQYARGVEKTGELMWGKFKINFEETAINFDMPVYFFSGIKDLNAPTDLVRDYVNVIVAPHKELIIFERSGHWPTFEEPEAFRKVLIDKLIKKHQPK
ncbi:MAG: alpha/beta hydrolase [Gammaproteobacteria bacterium]|nr:alpha/beta hydrolase [Gammaproteobacteria bacterium]